MNSTSAFFQYYEKVYGKRWEGLLKSLCEDVQHVALVNPFANQGDVQEVLSMVRNLENVNSEKAEKKEIGMWRYRNEE